MSTLLPDSRKQPLLSVQEEDPENLDDEIQHKIPFRGGATLENLDEAYQSEHDDDEEEEDEVENEDKAPIRRFGSQMGLFSKFTNAPTLDEFAIAGLLQQIEEKPTEEQAETAPPPLQSMWSFRGSIYDSEIAAEMIAKRTEYNKWYRASIMAVIFSTQFAGALELVYISPLFNRMTLPPLLDATVWIFPVFFITLATPFVNIFASHLQYERVTHMVMMALSIIGCLIFAFLDQFLPLITTDPASMRVWTIYLGFLAFCLLDVSNEMTTLVQNKMVLADEQLDTRFNNKLSAIASIAKILAYLTGTFEAFGADFSNSIIPRNLDLCFILAAVLLFTGLIMAALYQTAPTKGYRGSLMKKVKQLQALHFLPPLRRIFRNTKKLKLIVASHFFGSAGVLMLTVYVTLWVGGEIFQGDGRAPDGSQDYQNFRTGVSWGSFCLFLASILSAATKYVIYKATLPQNLTKKRISQLYIGSLLLGSLITILIQFSGTNNYWFILLLLSGPALETFHVLPGILGDLAEVEETKKHLGHYRHLLSFSLFYAQVLMFLVVPLFFLLAPDRDDNLWGMLSAGSSMLVAGVIGYFI